MSFKNELKSILAAKGMSIGELNEKLTELTGVSCSYANFNRKLSTIFLKLDEAIDIAKILNFNIVCKKEDFYINVSNQNIENKDLTYFDFLDSVHILDFKVIWVSNDSRKEERMIF